MQQDSKKKKAAIQDAYFAYHEKKISMAQFRARLRDLGLSDVEIEIYIDGDVA